MLKKIVYQLIEPLNTIFLKRRKGLRVLAYHTIPSRDQFEKQLKYLKENFSVLDMNELRNHLFQKTELPDNALLITFDDGDITFLRNGLPALKKFKLPAIVFIITELINTNRTFWCRQVEFVFEQKEKTYTEARNQVNYLKKISEKERKAYLKTLPHVESEQLTSHDLEVLIENKISVGNHTHSHPMVNNCSGTEITEELKTVREKFQEWNIKGYSVFAYPNGNWDENAERNLKENGIEIAFLFDHKINVGDINPLRISRIRVDSDQDLYEFKAKVSGLHQELMNLNNKVIWTNE